MGKSPYRLPADFLSLPSAEQFFTLANLDRISYSIEPILGLNKRLHQLAVAGARAYEDPRFVSSPAFPSSSVYGWNSNWAGPPEPPLLAYYSWMYDDGPGSFNLDCMEPGDQGCWGHRQNFLWDPSKLPYGPLTLSMGAAAAAGAYTTLLVATDESVSPRYYYTWEEAIADGTDQHRRQLKGIVDP